MRVSSTLLLVLLTLPTFILLRPGIVVVAAFTVSIRNRFCPIINHAHNHKILTSFHQRSDMVPNGAEIHMTAHDDNNPGAVDNGYIEEDRTNNDKSSPPPSSSSSDNEFDFGPLDVMLAKARKRPATRLYYYKFVAFFNQPLLKLTLPSMNTDITDMDRKPSFITVGDTIFITLAFCLGSVGFSFGWFFGRLTTNVVRNVKSLPSGLAELWTVGLAIFFDTVYVNVR